MALPRSQEDGRREEPPACREDGRHLARRVHRLLRTHGGPSRPHHFPESALRQGELLESYRALRCQHFAGIAAGRHTVAGTPTRLAAFLRYASIPWRASALDKLEQCCGVCPSVIAGGGTPPPNTSGGRKEQKPEPHTRIHT